MIIFFFLATFVCLSEISLSIFAIIDPKLASHNDTDDLLAVYVLIFDLLTMVSLAFTYALISSIIYLMQHLNHVIKIIADDQVNMNSTKSEQKYLKLLLTLFTASYGLS